METYFNLRPDAKGRICLGDLAKGVSSFRVTCDTDQRIILEAYTEIPLREKWVWDNPECLATLQRGIREAERGEVFDLGTFQE